MVVVLIVKLKLLMLKKILLEACIWIWVFLVVIFGIFIKVELLFGVVFSRVYG